MPNYCTNELFILGNKEQIAELKKQLIVLGEDNHEQITFENIFPTPEALVNLTSPTRAEEGETEEQFELRNKTNLELYGATDWYDWRVQNWGTKWDSCDTFYVDNKKDYELKIGFSTAWAPPIGVLEKIGELYPELEITCYYMEEGVGFCGMFYTNDGMSSNEEAEIEYQDEYGRAVEYNSELECYVYLDTKEQLDEDEDVQSVNPFQLD